MHFTDSNMNGKVTKMDDQSDLLNPFVHHLELTSTYEKIKTAVLTVALLPVRVLVICILLVLAWLLACVGLYGISDDDLRRRPLVGWRRALVRVLCRLGQGTYQAGGMNIVLKGRQADRAEAPILVIAPHSTFMDAIIVYVTGFPSLIARRESGLNPFVGKLINYTQPVYVWRDDPDSRQNTIKEIVDRATSKLDWPQVLIFPEGTCTNRSCLITFKIGAFIPGVPVQPVCIRYPNKLDTVTWTWEGPGALKLMWLTLTQLNSSCEIEFLPVYNPSEAERQDPKLYAKNVRTLMAKALGIPVSDYTYDDCKLINKALKLNMPCASDLVKVQKLRSKLGLQAQGIEDEINSAHLLVDKSIDLPKFSEVLKIEQSNVALQQLFAVYNKDNLGVIDIREYLLESLVISSSSKTEEMVRLAFKIVSDAQGNVIELYAIQAMLLTLCVTRDEAHAIFSKVDKMHRGYITFDELASYASRRSKFASIFPRSKEDFSSDDSYSERSTPEPRDESHSRPKKE